MSYQMFAAAGMTAIGSVTSLAAADAREGEYKQQAVQYREAADEAKTQALQEEMKRRERLRVVTASNMAELATRGLTSDSPSYMAIDAANVEAATIDIANVKYMGAGRARRFELNAKGAEQNARNAHTAGMIGVLSNFVSMGSQGYQGFGSTGWGSGGGGGGGAGIGGGGGSMRSGMSFDAGIS